MSEGKLKKHLKTSEQIYWVKEGDASDSEIVSSNGWVSSNLFDEAKKEFPIKFKRREDGILVSVINRPSYELEVDIISWYLKWFGEI